MNGNIRGRALDHRRTWHLRGEDNEIKGLDPGAESFDVTLQTSEVRQIPGGHMDNCGSAGGQCVLRNLAHPISVPVVILVSGHFKNPLPIGPLSREFTGESCHGIG